MSFVSCPAHSLMVHRRLARVWPVGRSSSSRLAYLIHHQLVSPKRGVGGVFLVCWVLMAMRFSTNIRTSQALTHIADVIICMFLFFQFFADCGKCRFDTKRLNLNKFCKRDYGNFFTTFQFHLRDSFLFLASWEQRIRWWNLRRML